MASNAKEQLVSCLAGHSEIVVAWLFGSTARGDESPGSDLDVAILWEPAPANPLLARAKLAEDLARATGKEVDVIALDDAPPALAGRVIREGEVLLCRDKPTRVRYEIGAMRRDLDTIHLRRLYDETLARAIREGRFYG